MKRMMTCAVALTICCAMCLGEDQKSAKPPSQEEMMAMFTKLSTPNENHKKLESMAGEWKADVKAWMGPGEPERTQGTCRNEMILGGRFLKSDFSGTMMGKPFKGFQLMGYDNQKKKFVTVWIDEMSTSVMVSEGTCDGSGKTLTQTSDFLCPFTNTMQKMRMITQIVDADTMKFELYGPPPGSDKEMKMMDIVYTRVK